MAKLSRSKRKATTRKQTATKAATKKMADSSKTSKPQLVIDRSPLPASWTIGRRAFAVVRRHAGLFTQLALVYLVLDLLVVRSITAFNVNGLRESIDAGALLSSFSIFSALFANAATGTAQAASAAYRFFLLILMSLAVIWALRQVYAATADQPAPSLKATMYQSTGPLVQFLLLLLLLGLQLVPLLLGLTIYTLIVGGGIAVTIVEQLIFFAVLLATAMLSLYWLPRTAVALYIVTLPGIQPLQAYRSAKDLIRGRRLSVLRKLLFLPLALFVIAAVIMVPAILIWAPLAQWLFFAMTAVGFIAIHAYLFTLYRELLPHEQG